MRIVWLAGSLVLALILAVISGSSPRPAGPDASATDFSATRAMADVREIARAPHPVGSAEHARVEAWLTARMTALGLSPEVQTGPFSPAAVRRLARWGVDAGPELRVRNLVGVLPGQDRAAAPLLLMAHYDSVPGSPGAADDAAGVAAILETVRALKARGPLPRDLVVLFTDAEELNLDGARNFFGGHPLRDRIGAVINLEARGGGGRALMFETGRGDAATVARYAALAPRVSGGVNGNSLAVFVYSLMPNGTDFTIARNRGVPGMNFAFLGRPSHYHAPESTPDSLDQGALQHMGEQALEGAALLAIDPAPAAHDDAVFADVFGRFVLHHPPGFGWALLALALLLGLFVAWRARPAPADVGRGVLDGLWFLSMGLVAVHLVRLAAGPIGSRIASAETYYLMLRRLPWIEAGVSVAVLAVALLVVAGRETLRLRHRRMVAAAFALAALIIVSVTGLDIVVLGALAIALLLTWPGGLSARSAWGGALGLAALVLTVATALQILAPRTAFVFLWPLLLGLAGWAAAAAFVSPRLERPAALALAAAPLVLVGGWLLAMGHWVFLGVGADLPGAAVLLALPLLALMRPLTEDGKPKRGLCVTALVLLTLSFALSGWSQLAQAAGPPGL